MQRDFGMGGWEGEGGDGSSDAGDVCALQAKGLNVFHQSTYVHLYLRFVKGS